jgi:hypothetical protein
MSKDLLVRMEVPIPTQPIVCHPGLIFNRWLPLEEGEALVFDGTDLATRIWFDMSCLDQGFVDLMHDLSGWANVTVAKAFVDVTAKNISDELIDFIFCPPQRSVNENPQMKLRFEDLSRNVIPTALRCLERLIDYFRNEKGQYWLGNYRCLYDTYLLDDRTRTPFHVAFKAKARTATEDWVDWKPPYTGVLAIPGGLESRYVGREDWPQVRAFINSLARPTLILELLANSEGLARNGFRRSALIEAVSALEIAVVNFSKAPRWDKIVAPDIVGRIDTRSLASQVEHLGFSGTLRYLIPILVDREILPSELLSNCYDALMERHNIIHNGQRDIPKKKLLPLIMAVRQVCGTLENLTA